MESKTWCPTKLKANKWQSNRNEKYWDDCKLPDWVKCMFIPRLKATVWSDEYERLKGDKFVDEEKTRDGISTNNKTNESTLIYDGISAITSLLEERVGDNSTLHEDEKQELNEEIAKKVKEYLTEGKIDKNNIVGENTKRNGVLEKGMSDVVEALIVKAVLDKQRYGNITSYLEGLKKWEIRGDYIQRLENKKRSIESKQRDKLEKRKDRLYREKFYQ